jgi:DNA polymerase-3 subunit beta
MRNDQLEVIGGASRFQLPAMNPERFPDPSEPVGEEWEMPGSDLARILRAAMPATSNDGTRPILCGVGLQADETELRAVATDTHRLHVASAGRVGAAYGASIVPGRMAGLILDGLDPDRCWAVRVGPNQIQVADGQTTIISRLIDGVFPPYTRVIPTNSTTTWTVDTDTLDSSLRRLLLVAEKGAIAHRVILEPTGDGQLRLNAATDDGQAEDLIAVEVAGEPLRIAFDVKNLRLSLAAFRELGVQRVAIQMGQPLTPVLIEAAGGGALRAVVMPYAIH